MAEHAALSPTRSPTVKRKQSSRKRGVSQLPPFPTQESHDAALKNIRAALLSQTSYDVFPVSFRIIVLDTKLEVNKALQCLLSNGVVSAPLWNSEQSKFAGMFTVSDIIHLIQFYYKTQETTFESAAADVETLRLESLREIEKRLGVAPVPLIHEHPSSSLYKAARRLIKTHARRLPLVDLDTETGHEIIVSVLTQYRLLKYVSINYGRDVAGLHLPLRKLQIGTYVAASPNSPTQPSPNGENEKKNDNPFHPIATATLKTKVYNVVHMFSERGISAVPIVDDNGVVVNLYETVDVITLVRLGAYQSLDLTVKEALNERSPDFPGVVICNANDSLGTLLQLIKKRRVHRLVVVEGEAEERQGGKKGRLLGIISLSDVLRYVVGNPGPGETEDDE